MLRCWHTVVQIYDRASQAQERLHVSLGLRALVVKECFQFLGIGKDHSASYHMTQMPHLFESKLVLAELQSEVGLV